MKIILATSALMLATAAAAQTPPVSGTTNSMQPDATMPPDSSPMTDDMDMSEDPSTTQTPMTTTPRSPVTTPSMQTPRPAPVNNMGNPRTAPQPNPVNNPTPGRNMGATQPAPMAGPYSTGMGEYPVCSKTVTDRCVNPNDIRRGIAKRPTAPRAARPRR